MHWKINICIKKINICIKKQIYAKRYPEIYNNISYRLGLCPIAESIQPKLMQFKTNYRNLDIAKYKSDILYKLAKKYI